MKEDMWSLEFIYDRISQFEIIFTTFSFSGCVPIILCIDWQFPGNGHLTKCDLSGSRAEEHSDMGKNTIGRFSLGKRSKKRASIPNGNLEPD